VSSKCTREGLTTALTQLVQAGALKIEYDREGIQRFRVTLPPRFYKDFSAEGKRAAVAKAAKA
jgi:hypothetical protein